MEEVAALIKRFGGAAILAGLLGSSRTAVSNWSRDGIPAKHWHALVELSREQPDDAPLSFSELERFAASRMKRHSTSEQASAS